MASGVKAQQGGCTSLFRCCSAPAADIFEEGGHLGPSSTEHSQFHQLSHFSLQQCSKLYSDQSPEPPASVPIMVPLENLPASPFGQAQIQQARALAHHTTPLEIPPSAASSPASHTPTGPASSPRGQQLATPHSQLSSGGHTPKSKNLRHMLHNQPGSSATHKPNGTAVRSTPLNVLDAPPHIDVDEHDLQGEFFVRKSGLSHATMELHLPRLPRLRPSSSGLHVDDFEKAPATPTALELNHLDKRRRSRSINSSKYLHKMPSLKHLQNKADALYRHSLHESASMGSLKSMGSMSMLRGGSLDGACNPLVMRPNTPPARANEESYRLSSTSQKVGSCSQLAGTSASQLSGCSPRDSGASRMSGMVRRGVSPTSTSSMLPDLGGTSGSELESLQTCTSSPMPDDSDLPALGSGRDNMPLKAPSHSIDVGDFNAQCKQPSSPGSHSRDNCPTSPGIASVRSSCKSPRSKSTGRSRLRRSASQVYSPSQREQRVNEGEGEEEWYALVRQACSKLADAPDASRESNALDPAQAAAHVRLAASLAGVPDCVPQRLPSSGRRSIHI